MGTKKKSNHGVGRATAVIKIETGYCFGAKEIIREAGGRVFTLLTVTLLIQAKKRARRKPRHRRQLSGGGGGGGVRDGKGPSKD